MTTNTLTKTVIRSFVGDTIQRSVPVTLNDLSGSDNDMTGWDFRVELDSTSPAATAIGHESITVDDTTDITEGIFHFTITDEQTGTLDAGTYRLYGKLQSSGGDEFTVIDATVVLREEGIE